MNAISMTVTETVTYKFRLDPDEIDLPDGVLDDPDALRDWIQENEDLWIDECNDSNFDACQERDIDEIKVVTLVPLDHC